MDDRQENTSTAGGDAAITVFITMTVAMLFILPVILALGLLIILDPECFRRVVLRKGKLPITAQPNCERARHTPLSTRTRKAALRLRETASATGGAIALRTREIFGKIGGYTSGLFEGRRRRRRNGHGAFTDNLPIMRQKTWQKLAESHTEHTVASAKEDGIELKNVEDTKKSTKAVHFDLGGGEGMESCVQKPEPAVVAGSKA
ncbi:hypothetical protein diail_8361 [Diaporthe ilicicola]|nr:hypothetical protein diail_8361 [Diaporthe ilicicola]